MNSLSKISVMSVQYCYLATVSSSNFKDLLYNQPDVKESIMSGILDNPFDLERD
jgi:hypothetical protein